MSDYNFSYDDFDSMLNDASFDFNSVNDIDLGGYLADFDTSNINGLDLLGEFNVDPGAFSFGDIGSMLNDASLGVGDFFDPSAPLLTPEGIDESFLSNFDSDEGGGAIPFGEPSPDYKKQPSAEERAAELERYEKFLADQEAGNNPAGKTADVEKQGYGASTDVDKSLSDMGDRGTKLTSDWQKTKDGRYVKINDDGSGIGIDEDGNSFALSQSQVQDRIKSGDLNTYASGYYTATGGDKNAPGGGRPVTLNNGKTGTLKPGGTVIDNDTGKEIGTIKDVKGGKDGNDGKGGKGGGTGSGGGSGSKDNSLSSLLPLLLMMMMMNKDKGGGGSSTVIPGLTATQRQTPYTQQQRAPGARPGQGGITYFDQTQYAPKMASGGIARLLKGPGDGVSDSIPAVIDGGMAGGGQPAKVARGEYIIDARTVAALGNGSTDAGAERLDKMRKNILSDDRRAGVGKDSKAYRHLLA